MLTHRGRTSIRHAVLIAPQSRKRLFQYRANNGRNPAIAITAGLVIACLGGGKNSADINHRLAALRECAAKITNGMGSVMIVLRRFEEYQLGTIRETSRTITEVDIVIHAGQTGDFYPHHIDAE